MCMCNRLANLDFFTVVRVLHVHWLLLPRSCLGHHGGADQPNVRGGQRDPHFCLRQPSEGALSWVSGGYVLSLEMSMRRNELLNDDGNDFE